MKDSIKHVAPIKRLNVHRCTLPAGPLQRGMKRTTTHNQFASSVPPGLPFDFGNVGPPAPAARDAAALAPARSLELNKLWKKFCNTSCCVCPPVELCDALRVGDAGVRPVVDVPAPPGADNPDVGRAPPLDRRREASPFTLAFNAPLPPNPVSISASAFSTFGRLKLLLPSGPTIPAVAVSVGLRNAPRGSRSGFFEFSS